MWPQSWGAGLGTQAGNWAGGAEWVQKLSIVFGLRQTRLVAVGGGGGRWRFTRAPAGMLTWYAGKVGLWTCFSPSYVEG